MTGRGGNAVWVVLKGGWCYSVGAVTYGAIPRYGLHYNQLAQEKTLHCLTCQTQMAWKPWTGMEQKNLQWQSERERERLYITYPTYWFMSQLKHHQKTILVIQCSLVKRIWHVWWTILHKMTLGLRPYSRINLLFFFLCCTLLSDTIRRKSMTFIKMKYFFKLKSKCPHMRTVTHNTLANLPV